MTLHTISWGTHVGRVFCGPWALAALTGRPLDDVHATVRFCRARGYGVGRELLNIRGMWHQEMAWCLSALGYRTDVVGQYRVRPSLGRWCAVLDEQRVAGSFLVHVGWHYVTVGQDPSGATRVSCTMQHRPGAQCFGEPVGWRDARGLNRFVKTAWAVSQA